MKISGIAASTIYLAWSAGAQAHVEGIVERTLAATPAASGRVLVTPTPFNTMLWRVVVMGDGGYREGYYSVLDRTGRVQLPSEFVSALGLRDRVRLELEPDHVGVWGDRTRPVEQEEQP